MHLVSGPQGPRIVLDGRPVTVLCSASYLGLADHPQVCRAAADAALRWGVGTGGPQSACGTMTVHRRLEERLADLLGAQAALLAGSGYVAAMAGVGALAPPGTTVLSDDRCAGALEDACRLAGAEARTYAFGDLDHLTWLLREARGRTLHPPVVVTESVLSHDGAVAPLGELVELTRRHRARLVVDESHGLGCLGPDGRGALAEAGLDGEADLVISSLGCALGAHGGVLAGDADTIDAIAVGATALSASAAPPPPAAAAALTALGLLAEGPRRVAKLQANAGVLRDALAREGLEVGPSETQVMTVSAGDPDRARALREDALQGGVLVEARPGEAHVRLTVMASHRSSELQIAAAVLGRAVRAVATDARPPSLEARVFDGQARLAA
jgi:glycine C-acetyltransferase/8-amino-7-oxononanoate synthase